MSRNAGCFYYASTKAILSLISFSFPFSNLNQCHAFSSFVDLIHNLSCSTTNHETNNK